MIEYALAGQVVFSTVKHFETILPALEEIMKRFGDAVYFKLIGDPSYFNIKLKLQGARWQAETEAEDLSELDIGLMPLPDNEWTRGKCAMKGLQYMALENTYYHVTSWSKFRYYPRWRKWIFSYFYRRVGRENFSTD